MKKFIFRFMLPLFPLTFVYGMAQVPKLLQAFGVVKPAFRPSENQTAAAPSTHAAIPAERNSVSGGIMIDGQRMVKINGKYYPYREDGVYSLENGERVFHVDNSADRRIAEENQNDKTPSAAGKILNALKPTASLQLGDMETLQKAQEFLKERNQYLNEITNSKE